MKIFIILPSAHLAIAASVVNSSKADSSVDECSDPSPITCEDGQDPKYIPQSSVQCAHYVCPPAKPDNSNENNTGNSSSKSVVLPAVLGTIIPLVIIGVGVFLFLHYRRRNRRSVEAQHKDAKYMSSYNHLEEGALSPYSVSKWHDPMAAEVDTSNSRASIPIIFSADMSQRPSEDNRETKLFGTEEGAAYRETRLYNGVASEEARKWAAPNVVNLPQMPQKVNIQQAGSLQAGAPELAIDTTNVRIPHVTEMDAESPETPESPEVTQISSPITTQPRIVQVAKPQIIRTIGLESASEQASPGSPLRVADNGWDSDSDESDAEAARDSGVTGRKSPSNNPLPLETSQEGSFSKEVLQAAESVDKST
ncbi:hypothetical protein IWW36_003405 [Coemansia brasiliensis]|uniref:Uncharacterized protein n=1 Tax=Coemansia brasiliensis TaxID=2650707 RepID=A0A9W8IE45_9FUNG|nr:hypothetical protein IWW36_003405 [Coemansia brasiliensis]